MRLIFTSIFILFTHISLSSEYIVRTKQTGFYEISSKDITNLKINASKTLLGDIKITNTSGEHPYIIEPNKTQQDENSNLVFFAEALKGKHAKQHEHDDDNGFKLSLSKSKTQDHNNWTYQANSLTELPTCDNIFTRTHYEANKLLIRVSKSEYKQEKELWYWKKLNYLLKNGFSIPLDLSKAKPNKNLVLTTAFRGRNIDKRAKDIHDHEIQIMINGNLINTLKWEGKIQHLSDKIIIPKEILKPKNNSITFKVPKRKVDNKAIIDMSMLDYFQIQYEIDASQITSEDSLSSDNKCKLELSKNQLAYSKSNQKYSFTDIELNPNSNVHIGNLNDIKKPGIKLVQPINVNLEEIEYLMITHPLFKGTLQKFADFYNNKGIKTTIIDTEQIYHRYSYGVRELYAIKDLIRETHSKSNGKLKHVLLAGDSSWDWRDNGKNNLYGKRSGVNDNFAAFPHQDSYTKEYINRDFVPTGQYHSSAGHSASDNWFVSIVPEDEQIGEDFTPDLAIGRFPASTNEELDAMIEKTINYSKNTKVGPWKSRVLWITNANEKYQSRSVESAKLLSEYGVSSNKIFPKEVDGDNFKVQETLSSSFDEGNLIVHFIGHGGKSIWRVGPTDIKKNRDLFTLDHISKLNNSKTLPFVMSMSCFSAPFDHPFADSIGEKFIREPKVGALAVLASSWRNTPNNTFSKYILESIFQNPQQSIGQAVLAGKRHFGGRTMVEMYNLLGDPAVVLAIPTLNMTTEIKNNEMYANIDVHSFKGKVEIDFLDNNNNVLSTYKKDISDPKFKVDIETIPEGCIQGRVYAWDNQQNIDAISSLNCIDLQ